MVCSVVCPSKKSEVCTGSSQVDEMSFSSVPFATLQNMSWHCICIPQHNGGPSNLRMAESKPVVDARNLICRASSFDRLTMTNVQVQAGSHIKVGYFKIWIGVIQNRLLQLLHIL